MKQFRLPASHISHLTPRILHHVSGLTFFVLLITGCAGYQVGVQPLYRPDIHTVHVPIFQSDSYRRNLGEWLTEAVMKELEQSTPFKVVGTPLADSVLEGHIDYDRKRTLVENAADEPRDIEYSLNIHVRWTDQRGGLLMERTMGIPTTLLVAANTSLVPEVGQSIVTAEQEAVTRLAKQIVGQMELPW